MGVFFRNDWLPAPRTWVRIQWFTGLEPTGLAVGLVLNPCVPRQARKRPKRSRARYWALYWPVQAPDWFV